MDSACAEIIKLAEKVMDGGEITEEEAKKLKFKLDKNGNFKHNNFYMKNLATIKNIELRNYCYCVLFYNTITWSKEYYSTKGHPYNVDDIFNEYI